MGQIRNQKAIRKYFEIYESEPYTKIYGKWSESSNKEIYSGKCLHLGKTVFKSTSKMYISKQNKNLNLNLAEEGNNTDLSRYN